MRRPFLSLYLLLSTALYAQKTLQEARVEENLFILKIIGIVVLLLVAMPFIRRKLRERAPNEEIRHTHSAQKKSKRAVVKGKTETEEVVQEAVDSLESSVETLLDERRVPLEKREDYRPLYRRYLELKAGKVETKTGSFDFNDVLSAVSTKVHTLEEERNFEIVFDIDAKVPSQLIGDAEKISDLLFFILQNTVSKSSTYVIVLKVRRLNLGDQAAHLEFYIPYAKDNYQEENLDIFTPFVGGETDTKVELYLAREYARLMHGDVTFELLNDNDSAFVVELRLLMPNPSEMRHYRLPSKTMTGHSVLLVDDHKESALAIQKMFVYFKNETDLFSSKELFSNLGILDDYDIVVIQERYFSKILREELNKIKASREIKVVSLNKNESFEHSDMETRALLDGEIYKPVTVQKVYDLLVSLYQDKR